MTAQTLRLSTEPAAPRPQLARWARQLRPSALQEQVVLATRPGILAFSLGLPAQELFPRDALDRASARVFANRDSLQYRLPLGALKEQIVGLMKLRGVECTSEQVFLTAGSQQGMSMLALLLLNEGGKVLSERSIYPGFAQAVMAMRPRHLTVPTDLDTGVDVEAVERILATERPAFMYLIPDGHNPLGVSISLEKRQRLVEVAARYGVPLIEDDVYGFLQYGDPLPPLRALDPENVFYLGSFSKVLAPALRVGWMVVPTALTEPLSVLKEALDINTTTATQRIVSAFLEEGGFQEHVRTIAAGYRKRRDAMLSALEQHFGDVARFTRPRAGFFTYVQLPDLVDTARLLPRVADAGIAYLPGSGFCLDGSREGRSAMRLSFSNFPLERFDDVLGSLRGLLMPRDEGRP